MEAISEGEKEGSPDGTKDGYSDGELDGLADETVDGSILVEMMVVRGVGTSDGDNVGSSEVTSVRGDVDRAVG